MSPLHREAHLVQRIGCLRAAALGTNDGIVSTASLIVGVAAASASAFDILVAGVAGLFAGAMSMAAGEYVSVSWQSDTEWSDLARERIELETQPDFEREELAQIYVGRSLPRDLARQVADQLMAQDALGCPRTRRARHFGSHERTTDPDSLDLGGHLRSRCGIAACVGVPAAVVGADCGRVGRVAAVSRHDRGLGAWTGGTNVARATSRVTFWGALAMGLTARIGAVFGTVSG